MGLKYTNMLSPDAFGSPRLGANSGDTVTFRVTYTVPEPNPLRGRRLLAYLRKNAWRINRRRP